MARRGLVPLLLIGGIVGPILFVGVFLVLGFVQPGYNPIQEHVSGLAFTRYGWVQTINFLLSGFLLLGFGTGLTFASGSGRSVGAGIAVGAVGLGLVVDAVYPSNIEHLIGAMFVWFGLTATCLALGAGLLRERRYGRAVYALVAGGIVFVFFWLAGQEWLGDLYIGNIAGLTQRISAITGLGVVLSIALAARRRQAAEAQV